MTKLIIALALFLGAFLIIERVFPGVKAAIRRARTRTRLSMLPSGEYITIENVPLDDQGSSRVDYAIVSKYGVFIISEKPYGGRVFGKVSEERWVRLVLGKEHPFKNPLLKLRQQQRAVAGILSLPLESVIPIVVFSGGASVWVKTASILIPGYQLRSTILSFREQLLSYDQVQKASLQLGEYDY